MRQKVACVLALASLVAVAIARNLVRQAHEVGELKSGLGDTRTALHLENLGAFVLAIAVLCGMCSIMLVLRERKTERFLIALGATMAVAIPLWIAMCCS